MEADTSFPTIASAASSKMRGGSPERDILAERADLDRAIAGQTLCTALAHMAERRPDEAALTWGEHAGPVARAYLSGDLDPHRAATAQDPSPRLSQRSSATVSRVSRMPAPYCTLLLPYQAGPTTRTTPASPSTSRS